MVKSILIAGLGGFTGTMLRFLITRFFQIHYISVFPWGTLAVNIAGSFLIGVVWSMSERGGWMPPAWHIFLSVGFCGGFTTFSSLTNDAFLLLQDKEFFLVTLYTSASFVLGLIAVFAGRLTVKMI